MLIEFFMIKIIIFYWKNLRYLFKSIDKPFHFYNFLV